MDSGLLTVGEPLSDIGGGSGVISGGELVMVEVEVEMEAE